MARPASPSPTLSAALDRDLRRDARRSLLFRPGRSLSYLMLSLHRFGAACLTGSGAALSRPRTPRSTPPHSPRREGPQVANVAVAVAERRPLREREEAATKRIHDAPAESKHESVTQSEMSVGDHSMQTQSEVSAGDHSIQSTPASSTVGRGGNIWVRVLPKTVTFQSQVDSPPTSAESTPAAEDEYVWADKYRPNFLKDFICNKDAARELYQQVTAQECNHIIFEGPPAVGKRSMVSALIRDALAPDGLKVDVTHLCTRFVQPNYLNLESHKCLCLILPFTDRGNNKEIRVEGHHVEVNLADIHGYEKHVITTLLNESIPSPNSICSHANCRVIVVHDADKLSYDLQHYIGWFLGRYVGCNKIMFCCSDASNLEDVRHLCKVVTLKPPSFDEIIKVLEYIAVQEGIDLPHDIARRITMSAGNNLRQAIRSFEATWKANYAFLEGHAILTGWEEEISNVAKKILEEPSSKQLFVIRGKIRKLIEHNVSPYFIFSHLVAELKRDRDEEFQNSIDELASELNRCKDCMLQKEQCKECKSRDTTLETRNINIEGFAKKGHDPGETIQCFIKIEEFTVRFMGFYRSLKAKNTNRGGGL
ncbi:replication factor C subunit 3-like isoform X2 [Oryza brachyantha]|uniref:replication factor C subunit 3-like isoform X2 n=1 Tax=Oryza brachyantha TaxID=4533 RepID=UPI001ADCFF1E|nr:replication factor C subunit 3-like isoform X2 [Oryza brachyantha]